MKIELVLYFFLTIFVGLLLSLSFEFMEKKKEWNKLNEGGKCNVLFCKEEASQPDMGGECYRGEQIINCSELYKGGVT